MPKSKAIEAKYKDDKNKANLEVQKMYKEEKVSPLSGCLWSLIPFPILIALFQVVRLPLSHMMHISAADIEAITNLPIIIASGLDIAGIANNQMPLMNAIHQNFDAVISGLPHLSGSLFNISFNFFGINLAEIPNYTKLNVYWILPIISGITSWASTVVMQKMQGKQPEQQQGSMKMMTYMGPVMSLVFGFTLPSAMSLYWTANSLFGMVQDIALTLYYRKKLGILSPAEQKEIELKEKEELARLEAARQERLQRLAESGPQTKNSNMSNKKYKQLKAQQRKPGDAKKEAVYNQDEEYDETDEGEAVDANASMEADE